MALTMNLRAIYEMSINTDEHHMSDYELVRVNALAGQIRDILSKHQYPIARQRRSFTRSFEEKENDNFQLKSNPSKISESLSSFPLSSSKYSSKVAIERTARYNLQEEYERFQELAHRLSRKELFRGRSELLEEFQFLFEKLWTSICSTVKPGNAFKTSRTLGYISSLAKHVLGKSRVKELKEDFSPQCYQRIGESLRDY